MNIKTKLIIFMILLIVIPVIAISIFSSSKSESNAVDIIKNNITTITLNQAANIDLYFEEIKTAARELASADALRAYITESNTSGFDPIAENEFYPEVRSKIENFMESDQSLQKVMVINNSGNIIASTNEDDIGGQMDNYTELASLISSNGGFSSLFMSKEEGNNIPVFICVRYIYSYDNERQGMVYQIHNTSRIQRLITNIQFNKYTTPALMDSAGNIFEYPYKSPKPYSKSENYKNAADYLKNIIDPNNDSDKSNFYEYSTKRGLRIVFSAEIATCHWTMLTVSDQYSIAGEVGKSGSAIRNFSVIVIILACVGSGIFIYFFTKPLDNVMYTLKKKLKGDTSARFNVNTKDELREISGVFETVFEDVFELEQRYKTIVEITNNIVFEVNLKNKHVTVSKNFNKKFSYRPKDDTLEESFLYKLRFHKDDKERFDADIEHIFAQADTIRGEYRVKSIYGDFIWVMVKATKIRSRDDIPIKIMGVIEDIDKEKKSEMHLIQRASFDNLTQLYNRETFIKSLAAQLELASSKKTLDAIMFIDLDDFKFFNDEYGHACGDEVLKFVADTLKEICFEHGFAGRFGGDEFVICVTDLTLYGDSGKIAQEIIDTLASGFISESTGEKLSIHCSVGIAFLIESGKTTEDVIAAADDAMYNIKKHGKSAYAYATKSDAAQSAQGHIYDDVSKAEDESSDHDAAV